MIFKRSAPPTTFPRRGGRPHRSLWRRIKRSDRILPRKLKFTREGRYLLLITLGVGFGAINTGNNLLYLVFSLLLALIVVSGVLSELTLRGLVVRMAHPPDFFAREPVFVELEVLNAKRRLASFSVEIEWATDDEVKQRPAHLLHLRPGARSIADLEVLRSQRGEILIDGLRLATRFPFGFFRKSRIIPREALLTVFPAIIPVRLPQAHSATTGNDQHRKRAGRGSEYYGLREQNAGDDARDVCWKVSARVGTPVVREFEAPQRRRMVLCFTAGLAEKRPESLEGLETVISTVASLAQRISAEGAEVGLLTDSVSLPPTGGPRGLHKLLHILATTEPFLAHPDRPINLDAPIDGQRLLVRHPRQGTLTIEAGAAIVHEVSEEPPNYAPPPDSPAQRSPNTEERAA